MCPHASFSDSRYSTVKTCQAYNCLSSNDVRENSLSARELWLVHKTPLASRSTSLSTPKRILDFAGANSAYHWCSRLTSVHASSGAFTWCARSSPLAVIDENYRTMAEHKRTLHSILHFPLHTRLLTYSTSLRYHSARNSNLYCLFETPTWLHTLRL